VEQKPTVNKNCFNEPTIMTVVNPVIRTITLFFTESHVCQVPKYWR